MQIKKLLSTLAGTAAIAAVAMTSITGAIAADRKLSLGVNTNATDSISDGYRFLAKRINELTNDELEVEIFWSSQLGGAKEMVQGIATGAIDMQLDVIELLVTFEPRIGTLSLPLVFRDRPHFAAFIGGPIFGEFLDGLESKGIIFPGRKSLGKPEVATNWVRPYDRGLVSNRPIYSPYDLKGFKLRMYESEIPIKSWQALGASVQVVPWPDVYTSLATGLVDGLTGTVSDNYDFKHFENAPYWTNIHEYYQLVHPWMSKVTWDSLTDGQRAAINQATEEASHEFKKNMSAANDSSRTKAQAEYGVSFITPPIGPWIEKMKPAHADFEERGLVEKGLVARIQAIK